MPKSLSKSHKAAISQGQIERHKRAKAAVVCEPQLKKCTKCGEWKPRLEGFTQRRRKNKSGDVTTYPSGECKECLAKRSAANRERLREQGLLRAREKEYNERRDKDATREYHREYQTIKRREEGVPARGAWKKYRDKSEHGVNRSALFPVGPIGDFLEEQVHKYGISAVQLAAGLSGTGLNELRYKEVEDISLERLDRILTGLGCTEQMQLLYPQEA